MNLLNSRMERIIQTGVQGAALKVVDLITLANDERGICTNLCFQNQDAASTVDIKMGVFRAGTLYAAQSTKALAAGLYKQLDNPIHLRENERLTINFTPSGATFEWQVWAEIHVFNMPLK